MSILELAKKIPDNVRHERLMTTLDPIETAIPVSANEQMRLLAVIWETFIEPHKKVEYHCGLCLSGILGNFKAMRSELMELEKEYLLLESL